MIEKKQILNNYVNGIADLQKKYKKDSENFVLLGLLLVYIIEYITAPHLKFVKRNASFILEIDIKDSKSVLKNIDNAIKGKGELYSPIMRFKKDNISILNYITKSRKIPQKSPILAITNKQRYAQLNEDAELMEQQNNISLLMNQVYFNKKIKIWNTQNDKRVRKTQFHTQVANLIIDIDKDFQIAGFTAKYPAHKTLPDYERFGCRCYLTYN